jgi:hypothetical protein
MANVSMKRVAAGAKLLKSLIKKVDNGDGTLTASEVDRAFGVKRGRPAPQEAVVALQAVKAAVNKVKVKSDRSVEGIVGAVDDAHGEVKSANADKSASLSDAEAKKVKTTLGKELLKFSREHGDDALSEFKLAARPPEYVPTKPFRAPTSGGAKAWVEAAIKHYNGWANDNSPGYSVPRGQQNPSRWVYGLTETRGLAKEIAALAPAKARAALRELSKRIMQPDYRSQNWTPKRLYVDAKGQAVLNALAKKLNVTVSFKGDPKAPAYDYY